MAAIVLGRVGYVLTHLDYFSEHVGEIVDLVRTPGLHGLAALVGAAAVGVVLRSLPLLAPTICLVGAAASLGCIPLGCGAGREVFWTDGALLWALRVDWPDATLTRSPRLPTQVFVAAWLAACGALSLRRPGWALAAAAMGAALTYSDSLL